MRTTIGTGVAFLSATLALVVVALWHLTQGTSGVGATDPVSYTHLTLPTSDLV